VAVSDSSILDFSGGATGPESGASGERRGWPALPIFLVVLVVGASVLAGWLHLARVRESDLAAFESLEQTVVLLDRDVSPLLHGSSPPCEESEDEGFITRTYSSETGPTSGELQAALEDRGFRQTTKAQGSFVTLQQRVDDHLLTVDVRGPVDAGGLRLRASSPASALACRFG
jgi:hypothetical protein